ncbi:hypothetical protein KUTeg_018121 [Tegillarca granosa]|uniref:Uncharacterized protein n=1 Tax=Tegillarca granosa TaxID=220873 RepID=A0ABQ9EGX5_TEGGR|nr:hypothetical protein KUTeg_018121 [Tegillarca granosa]
MTSESLPDYEIVIEDIILKVAKVIVSSSVIYGHTEVLKHTNTKYPYTKTEVKMMTIPAGRLNFTWDNMLQGKNPYNFENFNLNSIGLYVNSVPVSGNVMKLNYNESTGKTVIPVLINKLEATGKWLHDSDNGLTRKSISGRYALYCYTNEPNFKDGNLTLLKQGNVRLEDTFGTALSASTTCIVYAEYPGYFEISASRDIILE